MEQLALRRVFLIPAVLKAFRPVYESLFTKGIVLRFLYRHESGNSQNGVFICNGQGWLFFFISNKNQITVTVGGGSGFFSHNGIKHPCNDRNVPIDGFPNPFSKHFPVAFGYFIVCIAIAAGVKGFFEGSIRHDIRIAQHHLFGIFAVHL